MFATIIKKTYVNYANKKKTTLRSKVPFENRTEIMKKKQMLAIM